MTTVETKVIKIFEPFILGFCACGCGQEISIRRHSKNLLYKYIYAHASRGRKYKAKKGKEHHNFKTGRRMTGGYIELLKHEYFSSKKDGYVKEHIFVYQEYHKCCILSWGCVHHKDGNRINNEISNLEGMTKSRHTGLHNMGNKYGQKDMTGRKCLLCDSNKTYTDKKGHTQWSIYENGFMCSKCSAKEWWKNNIVTTIQ